MRENINLCDLKWNYPFLPRGSDISYCIENKDTLVAIRVSGSNSWDIYKVKLDILDIK